MVPLTMPMIREIRSPASDSRSGRISGMAPATAASKYRSAPAASAASVQLRAVLGQQRLVRGDHARRPRRSAVSSRSLVGSMPPITSTTTSMSSRATSAAASVVSSSAGMSGCRSGRRTATADQFQLRADPGGQLVGLLGQQPDHLGADDAGAEHARPGPHRVAPDALIVSRRAW